jgi:hypothetical protein
MDMEMKDYERSDIICKYNRILEQGQLSMGDGARWSVTIDPNGDLRCRLTTTTTDVIIPKSEVDASMSSCVISGKKRRGSRRHRRSRRHH